MKVAVGCPIRSRAWIFPEYVEHVRAAFDVAGLEPYWVFAVGLEPDGDDDETLDMVNDLEYEEGGSCWTIVELEAPRERVNWTQERYAQMVVCRNRLLKMVRDVEPDYFLSVDSDILLHPAALECMLETIQKGHEFRGPYAAVGGKAYLSRLSEHITTYAQLMGGSGLSRQDSSGTFPAQILMAIKLMSPAAYNVDYEAHQFGEDTGWSLACGRAGLVLGWDGRVCSKHIMTKENLHKVDSRVGW